MSIIKEFKEFAVKGNVVDMAVGIVIGAAFGKIVSSFVANIITPPIGVLVGGVQFSKLQIILTNTIDRKPITMKYGLFLQSVFDFIIVAFAIFMVVKGMNSLKRKEEEAPAKPTPPPKEQILLEEIRDLLKSK